MSTISLAQELLETARKMNEQGVNQGAAGNLSVRVGQSFLITPSAMHYDEMSADDLVEVSLEDGQVLSGGRPSSEWRFHRDILKTREDVNVVLHAHPVFCTALACQRRGIPPFHYMVAVAGGKRIDCADYALFGTQALSDHVLSALDDRRACLMANHGMIALAATLKSALALAVEVETLAAQYVRSLQIGTPVLLSDVEMDEALQAFSGYGTA